jgi:hypothetical protein
MGGEARFWRRWWGAYLTAERRVGCDCRLIGFWATELVIVRVTEETAGPVPPDGKLSLGSDATFPERFIVRCGNPTIGV